MIAIIDADFIIWKAVAGKDVLDIEEDKRAHYCRVKTDYIISSILKETKATGYIGYLTSGRDNYRYTINKTYKANRKDLKIPDNFHFIKAYLISNYNFKPVTEFEADDACMITYNYFKVENVDAVIVAVDKDLIRCCEGNFYKPNAYGKPAEFITNDFISAQINFWKSMICGDTADGLCGLEKKGEAWFNKNILGQAGISYLVSDLQKLVFKAYLDHYVVECLAIDKFYESYKCLKIIDSLVYSIQQGYEFDIPQPIPCNVKEVKTVEEFNIDNLF